MTRLIVVELELVLKEINKSSEGRRLPSVPALIEHPVVGSTLTELHQVVASSLLLGEPLATGCLEAVGLWTVVVHTPEPIILLTKAESQRITLRL